MMKYLAGLLVSFLFAGNLFAVNLCDSSCDVTISYPDGGSIQAIKPLTITFGEGGFINDGSSTEAFYDGQELSLAEGQSIVFGDNGSFDLGSGGNIDYSDIVVQSNGVMELSAIGGSKKVLIQDLTLLGGCSLNISSDFEVAETGMFHIFDGVVTASSDLSFTNRGSVSGLFVFENATLTVEETDYDVTGGVLIEADGQVTMTSQAVVIASAQSDPVYPADPVDPVDPIDDTSTDNGSDPGADSSSVSASDAGAGGGSGSLNLFGLVFVVLSLLAGRRKVCCGRWFPGFV